MPGGNRTGPMGAGPMSGKGYGICAGFRMHGSMNQQVLGGRAWGKGRRGFRNMYYATGLPGWARAGYDSESKLEYEKDILKNQANYLRRQLDNINKRLEELDETEDQVENE